MMISMFKRGIRLDRRDSINRCASRGGFTLIEVLVVAFIMLILAAIALPTLKTTLDGQKTSQTARQVVAFLREARSKAIASDQYVGVVLNRFTENSDYGRSICVQMQQTRPMTPYAGESDASVARLYYDSANYVNYINPLATTPEELPVFNAALFDPVDNPLLLLSANASGGVGAPIRVGDLLEVDRGRVMTITSIGRAVMADPALVATSATGPGQPGYHMSPGLNAVKVYFNAFNPDPVRSGVTTGPGSRVFPSGAAYTVIGAAGTRSTRFRIHRSPAFSSLAPLDLMKGRVIDLNYSGVGSQGADFSPFAIDAASVSSTATTSYGPVMILFAPDGSVEFVNWSTAAGTGLSTAPTGNIYLMVGDTKGVRPDALFSTDGRDTANIRDLGSLWVTINPSNGNVYVSPNASITLAPTAGAGSLSAAVSAARAFALRADNVNDQ